MQTTFHKLTAVVSAKKKQGAGVEKERTHHPSVSAAKNLQHQDIYPTQAWA